MDGKQVLITGGTGGLGQAVVLEALVRGATVHLPWHDRGEAQALLEKLGPATTAKSVVSVEADLRDEEEVHTFMRVMPRVDALIHLVGGFTMGPTHEVSLDDWRRHHDLTLTTTFLCCKHALARMREQGYGRIVTVGSRAAVQPAAQLAAYATAKAGVVALTKVIADETRGTDITANCVLPSTIDTPANRKAMGEENAHLWVQPSSLANTICDLASEPAGDIRGAAIPIYGNT